MAKKIRKNKNTKFLLLVLGLLLAIGILIFSNYLSKTTTSTDTKAAGNKQCTAYQSKRGCPKNLGCVSGGKWCKFVGTDNFQGLPDCEQYLNQTPSIFCGPESQTKLKGVLTRCYRKSSNSIWKCCLSDRYSSTDNDECLR